jgi:hypothetical protein
MLVRATLVFRTMHRRQKKSATLLREADRVHFAILTIAIAIIIARVNILQTRWRHAKRMVLSQDKERPRG